MRASGAAETIPGSGIREIMDLAVARPGTVRLEIGDPNFGTPAHIIESANRAAQRGDTHYAPTCGNFDLRSALGDKLARVNGIASTVEQTIVTQGATQGIYLALSAVTEPGDEVLVPDPAWPNYRMMTRLLHLTDVPYSLRLENAFVPAVQQLAERVSPRTRALILNSPSNPLGSIIDRALIEALMDFAARHGLWVVSDECYDEIVFDAPFVSAASVDQERVLTAMSFSKTYAMTGWRVGYLSVPASLRQVVRRCQESMLACVSSVAQAAALAAITGPQGCVAMMLSEYRQRRDEALRSFTEAGFPQFTPGGAFYIWIDTSSIDADSRRVALGLLEKDGIAVAPGTAFGTIGSSYVRISLAAGDSDIACGADAIIRKLKEAS